MVSLKALGARLYEREPLRLYPLEEALELAGITAPTFYRWIRSGKLEDCRIRGRRGRTQLTAEAVLKLREFATRVEYVSP